ncbi:MAG: hypothetical protein ACI8W1_002684, partial [Candidatus Azotimanducaceae bacterium]
WFGGSVAPAARLAPICDNALAKRFKLIKILNDILRWLAFSRYFVA